MLAVKNHLKGYKKALVNRKRKLNKLTSKDSSSANKTLLSNLPIKK